MYSPEIKNKIEAELEQARKARENGLEGQARVCARRAAGQAVHEYLQRRGEPISGPSVMDLLASFKERADTPEQMRSVAEHLLLRVSSDYSLPSPIDLLSETRWLVDTLETMD